MRLHYISSLLLPFSIVSAFDEVDPDDMVLGQHLAHVGPSYFSFVYPNKGIADIHPPGFELKIGPQTVHQFATKDITNVVFRVLRGLQLHPEREERSFSIFGQSGSFHPKNMRIRAAYMTPDGSSNAPMARNVGQQSPADVRVSGRSEIARIMSDHLLINLQKLSIIIQGEYELKKDDSSRSINGAFYLRTLDANVLAQVDLVQNATSGEPAIDMRSLKVNWGNFDLSFDQGRVGGLMNLAVGAVTRVFKNVLPRLVSKRLQEKLPEALYAEISPKFKRLSTERLNQQLENYGLQPPTVPRILIQDLRWSIYEAKLIIGFNLAYLNERRSRDVGVAKAAHEQASPRSEMSGETDTPRRKKFLGIF